MPWSLRHAKLLRAGSHSEAKQGPSLFYPSAHFCLWRYMSDTQRVLPGKGAWSVSSFVCTNREQPPPPQVSKERKAKGQHAFHSIAWNPSLTSTLLSAITHLGNTGMDARHPPWLPSAVYGPCHLGTAKSLEGNFDARHQFAFNPPSSRLCLIFQRWRLLVPSPHLWTRSSSFPPAVELSVLSPSCQWQRLCDLAQEFRRLWHRQPSSLSRLCITCSTHWAGKWSPCKPDPSHSLPITEGRKCLATHLKLKREFIVRVLGHILDVRIEVIQLNGALWNTKKRTLQNQRYGWNIDQHHTCVIDQHHTCVICWPPHLFNLLTPTPV